MSESATFEQPVQGQLDIAASAGRTREGTAALYVRTERRPGRERPEHLLVTTGGRIVYEVWEDPAEFAAPRVLSAMRRTILAGAVLLAFAGCGASDDPTTATREPAAELPAAGPEGCEPVRGPVRDAISTGLQHGSRLGKARGVRVGEVYVVAADLQGPGLGGKEDVARFVVGDLREQGYVFSADAVADAFSDWGRKTPDGVDQFMADDCL